MLPKDPNEFPSYLQCTGQMRLIDRGIRMGLSKKGVHITGRYLNQVTDDIRHAVVTDLCTTLWERLVEGESEGIARVERFIFCTARNHGARFTLPEGNQAKGGELSSYVANEVPCAEATLVRLRECLRRLPRHLRGVIREEYLEGRADEHKRAAHINRHLTSPMTLSQLRERKELALKSLRDCMERAA